MAILLNTIVIGVSSLILLLIGYIYAGLFLVKYFKVKKMLIPIVALVAFCCGNFYLGPSVSFISLILTEENISGELYYFLSYTLLPIGTMGIVLMALNIIRPKLQKLAIVVYGLLTLLFWVFMYGFTALQFEASVPATGELLDIGHIGVSRIVAALSLLSILTINSFGFFNLGLKFKKHKLPRRDIRKAFMIATGWFLFFLSGTVDALFPPASIGMIILLRLLMIIAFNLIYIGYWSKPTRLAQEAK